MLYRGGKSALTSARNVVTPLGRSVLAEPARRPGNAGRDVRRALQASPWVAVLELLRQRQVGAQLALAVDLDARGMRQRLPLGLGRRLARDALAQRSPRYRVGFARDFHGTALLVGFHVRHPVLAIGAPGNASAR